ncbi:MAG: hypothetical protein V3W41_10865 [Planctomycetota bacterium]
MATRTERVEEALNQFESHQDLIWAMALNEAPVRRSYLEEVAGLDRRTAVRTLAKMANAGILAATEGLEFEIDRKAYVNEFRDRVPAERAVEIHERSLDWAEAQEGIGDEFYLTHQLGARRYEVVADAVADRIRERAAAEESPRRQDLMFAKRSLLGLMEAPKDNKARLVELGLLTLQFGRSVLRPMEWKNLAISLRELGLNKSEEQGLVGLEDRVKAEAKDRRRAKAQGETEGETQATVAEEENSENGLVEDAAAVGDDAAVAP